MYQFHSFLWLYNIPLYTTGRIVYPAAFPIFKLGFFLCCWVVSLLYMLRILITYQIYDLQIFSPIKKKYIYVFIWLHWSSCGMQDLVLWPHVPRVGNVEFWPLDHQGSLSPILGGVFSLSVVSLSLIKFILSIFSFVVCTFSVISKKSLPNPMSEAFSLLFSSESLYF